VYADVVDPLYRMMNSPWLHSQGTRGNCANEHGPHVTRLMPPKRGNQKPKAKGQAKRKNSSNAAKEAAYNRMRNEQTQRWRDEAPRGRPKKTRLQSQGSMRGSIGAAALIRQPKIGMPDLMAHTVSWIAGSVYIGNNTLGANDGVYFLDSTGTYTVSQPVPVLGSDTNVGATYVAALEKLYRRKRYRRIRVCFLAIQSSTTNNMTLTVAPIRGPPDIGETGLGKTDTTAAIAQSAVMSMTGPKTVDSFEDAIIDLTPYIAGGAGSAQNEVAIGGQQATTSAVTSVAQLLGVSPAAFVVGGNSTVTALRGSKTHQVVIETVVDYLDFVGAVPTVDPAGAVWPHVAAKAESRDEKRVRLLAELSAVAREDSVERHRSPSKGKEERQ